MARIAAGVWIFMVVAAGVFAGATTGSLSVMVQTDSAATVTLRDLTDGRQWTRSADDGMIRFTSLSPGEYELSATGDDWLAEPVTVTALLGKELRVGLERSANGELALVIHPFDPSSTTGGTSVVIGDTLARLPVQREINHLALLAPGAIPGDSAFDGRTPGQDLVSFGGSSVAENRYLLDGIDITNFRNGLGSTFVPVIFVDQVEVATGGHSAVHRGATGGVVNLVTKRGGNQLHGEVSLFVEPEGLQEQEPNTYNRENQAEERRSLEANIALGGPLWKDRLFYFGFMRYLDERWEENQSEEHDPSAPSFGEHALSSRSDPFWGARVDGAISASHAASVTYLSDETTVRRARYGWDRGTGSGLGAVSAEGEETDRRGGRTVNVAYDGQVDDKVMISARFGSNDFNRDDELESDAYPYSYDLSDSGWVPEPSWINWRRESAADEQRAYQLGSNFVAGEHRIDAGIEAVRYTSEYLDDYKGGAFFRYDIAGNQGYLEDLHGNPLDPEQPIVRIRHLDIGGRFDATSNALYIQDVWTVSPGLTLSPGVRYERFESSDGMGGKFIDMAGSWAPRIGVVWDPSGRGRSQVFGSLGRYVVPVPTSANVALAGAENFDQNWYVWNGTRDWTGWPTGFVDCGFGDPSGCENSGAVENGIAFRLISDERIRDSRKTVASNLDPMSQDEITLGFEHALSQTWSIGVRGTWREVTEAVETISLNRGLWQTYGIACFDPDDPNYGHCANAVRLANPGSAFEGWYDVDGDRELDPISLSADALDYPNVERNYGAVELTFNRRFADRWMLQGSYTWSHLYGNYEGWVNSDTGEDDAGITNGFDHPGLMDHSSGNLPQDRRHNLKLYGSYAFDSGLWIGGNAYYRSGRMVNSFGEHPSDPFSAQYGIVSFYTDGEPSPRGSSGTTDNVYAVDIMIQQLATWIGLEWRVRLDVFNLFNFDAVTEVNEAGEDFRGYPNFRWGQPTHHQPPRRVRLGIAVTF